jgi:hypothetical protein
MRWWIALTGVTTGIVPLLAAVALAAPAPSAAGSAPRDRLVGFACHPALMPPDRSMYVRAVMRPVAGTRKMQMLFELRSSAAPGVTSLTGTGLDTWLTPTDPTLGRRPGDVWIVPHPIRDLVAPAVYHYHVLFRWLGSAGQVLSTQTLVSPGCNQPELRPDLLVASITLQPASNLLTEKYVAAIENRGATTARSFQVTFTPGPTSPGATPTVISRVVNRLAPGATKNVTFTGPACTPLTAPTVVVDPAHIVPEYDYADNSLTVAPTCPAVTTAPAP